MRVAALYELHGAFERDHRFGSEQQMDVVGHQHEFVKPKDLSIAIDEQSVQE